MLLAACATPQPIQGPAPDPAAVPTAMSVLDETAPYQPFAGLTPVELWHLLDSAEFDHVPLDPPAGYYSEIDSSDPVALRETLHERIRDHTVFLIQTNQAHVPVI